MPIQILLVCIPVFFLTGSWLAIDIIAAPWWSIEKEISVLTISDVVLLWMDGWYPFQKISSEASVLHSHCSSSTVTPGSGSKMFKA